MPYDIMKKIGTNVTIGSNIEFKNKVVFGDSILVYRKYRDPKTRKIVKEEVLPYEQPEIFEFLENNNFNFVRMDLALDLVKKAELSIMGSGQGAKKKKQVFAALRAKCPAAIRWAITDEVLDAVIEHAFDVMTAALGKKP